MEHFRSGDPNFLKRIFNGQKALPRVFAIHPVGNPFADPAELDAENIVFGATVTILDVDTDTEVTYQIVGEEEANIKEGKISVTSPVGRALIGHNIDDEVSIKVPSGIKLYEIVNIDYR